MRRGTEPARSLCASCILSAPAKDPCPPPALCFSRPAAEASAGLRKLKLRQIFGKPRYIRPICKSTGKNRMKNKATTGHPSALFTIYRLGSGVHLHKNPAGRFPAGGNFLFSFRHRPFGSAGRISPPFTGHGSAAGVDLCCGRPVRDMPVLSFKKYCAHLHNGFKCRRHPLCSPVFYSNPLSPVTKRRKTSDQLFYWLCRFHGRDYPHQI